MPTAPRCLQTEELTEAFPLFFIIIFLKIRITHFVFSLRNSCLCSSSRAVHASSVINGSIERWVKNVFLRHGVSQRGTGMERDERCVLLRVVRPKQAGL